MIRQICLLLSLLLHIFPLISQPGTGMLLEDESYDQLPLLPNYGQKGRIDTIHKLDLRPWCPAVIQQGPLATCTGWATAYATCSIQRAIQMGWEGQKQKITDQAYSAFFVYNQIKESANCFEGTSIFKALQLMKEKGNRLSSQFDRNGCESQVSMADLEQARHHRIRDFHRLFDKDASAYVKTHAIKQSLIDNKPVVVGVTISDQFQQLNNKQWWFPEVGNSSLLNLGHAMTVVGFDDGKGSKGGAFQLMNSWGRDWGEDGFIWVNYDDFAKYCFYAFQLTLNHSPDKRVQLTGKLDCKIPVFENNQLHFQEVAAVRQGTHYELNGYAWKSGDLFQLQLGEVTGERFVYVFSYDANGQLTVHWPRDEHLSDSFVGKHESAMIQSPSINLPLPNKNTAFELQQSGLEQLCILFSPFPLPNLKQQLKQSLERNGAELEQAIKETFASEIISPEHVSLQDSSIEFHVDPTHWKKIIPLFLHIQVE